MFGLTAPNVVDRCGEDPSRFSILSSRALRPAPTTQFFQIRGNEEFIESLLSVDALTQTQYLIHPASAIISGREMHGEVDTLSDQVRSAISSNPHLAGRKLRFESNEGRVILRGVVGSYFQKQMAQEAVRRVKGVTAIENALEVAWN